MKFGDLKMIINDFLKYATQTLDVAFWLIEKYVPFEIRNRTCKRMKSHGMW